MTRWVRIQASLLDHPLFADAERSPSDAWLWLIAHAAWAPTQHRIGSQVVTVPVGALFVTLRGLAAAWNWKSDKRVRTFLKLLEDHGMVVTRTDAGKTQITICNYTKYQEGGPPRDAARTQARRTKGTSTPETSSLRSDDLRTPREALSAVLDADRVEAVLDHRRSLRKPLTAHAARLLARKFAACPDPAAAADAMIANGWQGFEPEWLDRRQRPQNRPQAPPRKSAFQQHQDDCQREIDKVLGRTTDDDFTGNTLDLAARDRRADR